MPDQELKIYAYKIMLFNVSNAKEAYLNIYIFLLVTNRLWI